MLYNSFILNRLAIERNIDFGSLIFFWWKEEQYLSSPPTAKAVLAADTDF